MKSLSLALGGKLCFNQECVCGSNVYMHCVLIECPIWLLGFLCKMEIPRRSYRIVRRAWQSSCGDLLNTTPLALISNTSLILFYCHMTHISGEMLSVRLLTVSLLAAVTVVY